MCLEIYELDVAQFFSTPELELQVALKRAKVKLDSLTNINELLMLEKKYQRWNMSHC